ncbi:MAG: dihydrofolate synthase [Actinobacteria bacterium]|nr:dihydrofolate synthase [Actinomycetota bacterium]
MKPGLERTAGVLDLLGDPQNAYRTIHVAGTNGKGSTARLAAGLLDAHGLASGLFTSPHLHHVEERFEVRGAQMTEHQFAEAIAELKPIVELYEERAGQGITYFEMTAVLAFAWFAEQAVDVAVLETGLGGRLDATSTADADVAAVTTVGLEHTEYLGDTITEIAGEKLAIVPPGAVLVTGRLDDEAAAVAARVAAEREARWFRLGTEVRIDDAEREDEGWRVTIDGVYGTYPDLLLRQRGRHQVDNLAVAVAAVEALFGRELDPGAVSEAAGTVLIPGRMEVVATEPLLMVDGAHNPPGTTGLAAALREEFPGVRWHLVFGSMKDKDTAAILETLKPHAAGLTAVAADTTRARTSAEVAAIAAEILDGLPVADGGTVAEGLAAARAAGTPVLVTGSLYVVGEARLALGLA